MAGGMGGGSIPLRDRPVIGPGAAQSRPRRHCWVTGPESAPGLHAGLVTRWEQRPNGWHALVTYFIEADETLIQQWLPAAMLTPTAR